MDLRLGRPRADGAPRDEIGEELRADDIEVLDGRRQAHGRELAEQAASEAQALVDIVAAVELGVVDQALPADCVGVSRTLRKIGEPLASKRDDSGNSVSVRT